MAILPTYKQISKVYSLAWETTEKTEKGKRFKELNLAVKDAWDHNGRRNRSGTTIIKEIHDQLALKSYYILGSFKALYGMTHEEIYTQWTTTFSEKYYFDEGTSTSYFTIAHATLQEIFPEKVLTFQEAVVGICMMLYRSSIGIALESKVHETLKSLYAGQEHISIVPAPYSMEKEDVDILVKHAITGEVLLSISVKTLGALSESYIDTVYRGRLKKTTPELYCGYKNEHDESLTYFYRGITQAEATARIRAAC